MKIYSHAWPVKCISFLFKKTTFVPQSSNVATFCPCVAIPGPTSRPEVVDVTHEGMTVTWQPPVDNGGSTIAGYIIERKEARSDRWMRINKNPVTMTRYRSSGLIEGLEYEFRITAINSRGPGKPSESSAITVAMDPIGN